MSEERKKGSGGVVSRKKINKRKKNGEGDCFGRKILLVTVFFEVSEVEVWFLRENLLQEGKIRGKGKENERKKERKKEKENKE